MISVLCPTRGRPGNVRRMAESVFTLAVGPVELVLYADSDDPQLTELCTLVTELHDSQRLVTLIVGPRVVLSETWNRCADIARFPIMAHSDDDVVYRTPGWDQLVVNAFAEQTDRIVLVHGRDGIHDGAFGTHGFIHRAWVDTVGYFVPPYFSSDYNDTWLNEVANALGRRVFISELYTEHMHPAAGKAPWDVTYGERLARHSRDGVDALYASKAAERSIDVEKLRRVLL